MNKVLNIITVFFFITTISCNEKKHTNISSLSQQNDKSIQSSQNRTKYVLERLICTGEEFSPKKCTNEKKNVSISYDNGTINFLINNSRFQHNEIKFNGELGYNIFLYSDSNSKVILFDFFIENGHALYAYNYDGSQLLFIGEQEQIINEEQQLIKGYDVDRTGDNLIILIKNTNRNIKFDTRKGVKLESDSIDELMKNNISTPEKITNELIFIKDKENKLHINTNILDYIQKNTTATNNKYTIALEKYVTHEIIKFYDRHERNWTEEELVEIIAYASNTSDPLHKKYWKESPENWHNGMWGNILGFCYIVYPTSLWVKFQNQVKKENYYNLHQLKEMISYATEFDKFGPP